MTTALFILENVSLRADRLFLRKHRRNKRSARRLENVRFNGNWLYVYIMIIVNNDYLINKI